MDVNEKYGWRKCVRCGTTRPPHAVKQVVAEVRNEKGAVIEPAKFACTEAELEWCSKASGGVGQLTGAET